MSGRKTLLASAAKYDSTDQQGNLHVVPVPAALAPTAAVEEHQAVPVPKPAQLMPL